MTGVHAPSRLHTAPGRAAPRWVLRCVVMALCCVAVLVALVAWLNVRGEDALPAKAPPVKPSPDQIERGRYLATVGNCAACHTAPGGVAWAGGRGIETPFGVVFSSNLTPDAEVGLGRWNVAEFWRAMHHGRSRDGRLLYPAFPYPEYTRVTREDADAIFAFLQTLAPVHQAAPAHALRFPFNTQAALAVWRALFFEPASVAVDTSRPPAWNRGAYLVQGLGHCAACHSPRNAWGATDPALPLGGGRIPMQPWYAPALDRADEAGLAGWSMHDAVALLRHGVSPQASALGPMAEVVFRSTQYLSEPDAQAIVTYLQALPQRPATPSVSPPVAPPAAVMARGAKVYEAHCAQCHGAQGLGEKGLGEKGAFPALAGNRAVLMQDPTNVLQVVLQGGYAPATKGNPRPHGMPPFRQWLSDDEIAAVATYLRNSWGNQAPGVGTIEVYRARERRAAQ